MARAYGWADDGETVVEDEAKVLRAAAADVLAGKSLRSIAAALQDAGVATVTGKPWAPITLKRALTNPRIIGKQTVRGALVPAKALPILSPQTFRRLELELSPERTAARVDVMAGGLTVCGRCSTRLFALVTDHRSGYACSTRSGGCGKVWVKSELLEKDAGEEASAQLGVLLDRDPLMGMAWWATASRTDQRALLRLLLDEVRVNPTTKRGRQEVVEPGRFEYYWRTDVDVDSVWSLLASTVAA